MIDVGLQLLADGYGPLSGLELGFRVAIPLGKNQPDFTVLKKIRLAKCQNFVEPESALDHEPATEFDQGIGRDGAVLRFDFRYG